jgi:hypothetical protein
MRIKFQVDELITIFEYMDRGDKGYISYGDFCELSEEKRRCLDPVESKFPTAEEYREKSHLKKDNFYNTYLDDCNLEDLEEMSKRFGGHYLNRRQKNTMRLAHKDGGIPKWVRDNPEHRFGIKTALAKGEVSKIGHIINNDYLKEFLTTSIARKAKEEVHKKEKK